MAREGRVGTAFAYGGVFLYYLFLSLDRAVGVGYLLLLPPLVRDIQTLSCFGRQSHETRFRLESKNMGETRVHNHRFEGNLLNAIIRLSFMHYEDICDS